MSVQVAKRLFTVDEYHRMVDAGILSEEDRVELIEGEIVEMSPMGTRHASCLNRLNAFFSTRVGGAAIVWVQSPIDLLGRSEPEPELTLLRPQVDFYAQRHPGADDVLLAIEISDTSTEYDRTVKVPLYARAGIREAWQVVLPEDVIVVHRGPSAGGYRDVRRVGRGERLSPEAFANIELSTDSILG